MNDPPTLRLMAALEQALTDVGLVGFRAGTTG
jgi:hypothetical protein